ncbi:MAG: hypothetical protein ACXVH3_26840 [Solirubrobacteraceae bacterium]
MDALLLDAEPSLVVTNELREYSTPEAAVKGLIERWLSLREPLVLLWITHPVAEVRQAALMFQAEVELCLRHTADAAKSDGDITRARESYAKAAERARELGKLLSPFA